MVSLQTYFEDNFSKNDIQINFKGVGLKLEGNKLLIEKYAQLKYFSISDLPQLSELTIRNCDNLESLEIGLDKQIDIRLEGQFLKLKNFLLTNTQTQPIIIKKEEGFCLRCYLFPFVVIWNILLTLYVVYKMRTKNKKKT